MCLKNRYFEERIHWVPLFFWLNEILNVLSLAKQANRVQFGFKKFKKRLLAVFRTKMEKVLVKNQLRLKRLLMNGKQRKPR